MRSVIINGLGCPKTGGAIILRDLIAYIECNTDWYVWVFVSDQYPHLDEMPRVRIRYFSVPLWIANSPLRLAWEVLAGISLMHMHQGPIINLSNYGFLVGGHGVLMIHSPDILKGERKFSLSMAIKRFMMRWTLMEAQQVMVQTDHMKHDLACFVKQNQCSKPPIFKFFPILKARSVARPKRESGLVSLFYPASPFVHKRVDLCEDTARSGLLLRAHLTVIGSDLRNDYFTGLSIMPHADVIELLGRVDGLLFTSERETLGLPLLEAIALGLPAVLPDLPYAKEIYGDAAVYFDEFSVSSLSSAINRFCDSYEQLRGGVRERQKYLSSLGVFSHRFLVSGLSSFWGEVI